MKNFRKLSKLFIVICTERNREVNKQSEQLQFEALNNRMYYKITVLTVLFGSVIYCFAIECKLWSI